MCDSGIVLHRSHKTIILNQKLINFIVILKIQLIKKQCLEYRKVSLGEKLNSSLLNNPSKRKKRKSKTKNIKQYFQLHDNENNILRLARDI